MTILSHLVVRSPLSCYQRQLVRNRSKNDSNTDCSLRLPYYVKCKVGVFDHSVSCLQLSRRSVLIDYTQPDEDTPGEWKMVEVSSHHERCSIAYRPKHTPRIILTLLWQACKDCKVCIVTKSQKLSSGVLRFMTSIWALSDDRSTRLQQKCTALLFWRHVFRS